MDRLIEKKTHADRADARLAELVRACHVPRAESASRKERVLRGVLADRRSRGRRLAVFLRPAVALGVVLVAGATLAATVGHSWIAHRLGIGADVAPDPVLARRARRAATVAPAPAASAPALVAAPVAPVAPAAAAPVAPAAPVAVAPAPALVETPPVAPPRVRAVSRSGERARARSARGEDPARVVAAIRALRGDHDPVRAGRLLAEYLAIYPRGALSEEALALSIEAAVARHDARATGFAERYLREYPTGRFRHSAEQALRRD